MLFTCFCLFLDLFSSNNIFQSVQSKQFLWLYSRMLFLLNQISNWNQFNNGINYKNPFSILVSHRNCACAPSYEEVENKKVEKTIRLQRLQKWFSILNECCSSPHVVGAYRFTKIIFGKYTILAVCECLLPMWIEILMAQDRHGSNTHLYK